MNDDVILALAERWTKIADRPPTTFVEPAEQCGNASAADRARRETMRECAAALRTLVATFGDSDRPSIG